MCGCIRRGGSSTSRPELWLPWQQGEPSAASEAQRFACAAPRAPIPRSRQQRLPLAHLNCASSSAGQPVAMTACLCAAVLLAMLTTTYMACILSCGAGPWRDPRGWVDCCWPRYCCVAATRQPPCLACPALPAQQQRRSPRADPRCAAARRAPPPAAGWTTSAAQPGCRPAPSRKVGGQ